AYSRALLEQIAGNFDIAKDFLNSARKLASTDVERSMIKNLAEVRGGGRGGDLNAFNDVQNSTVVRDGHIQNALQAIDAYVKGKDLGPIEHEHLGRAIVAEIPKELVELFGGGVSYRRA